MGQRPFIIGMPITLLARGVNSAIGRLGGAGVGSVLSSGALKGLGVLAAGGAVAGVVAGGSIASIATGIPVLESMSGIIKQASTLFSSLITFMDMSANIVKTSEKRRLAVVSIPGRESDFIQDLGGHSTIFSVKGRFFETHPKHLSTSGIIQNILHMTLNNEAIGNTMLLRLLMRMAAPVPVMFEYDLSFAIIKSFDFTTAGGTPGYVDYSLELVEYQRVPYLAKLIALGAASNFL